MGGSLIGGANPFSGEISSSGDMVPVTIGANLPVGGDVVGSTGFASGSIFAGGNLTSVTVHGSLKGGAGLQRTDRHQPGNEG